MTAARSASNPFTVGGWYVEPSLNRITRNGESSTLRPQVIDVLVYFADRPGEVVTIDDLLEDVWKGRVVSEGSVYNCVSELRQALEDTDDTSPLFETIPKKGYRLAARVAAHRPHVSPRQQPLMVGLLVAAITVAGYAIWVSLPDNDPTGADAGIRSLAILPLDNLSPNPSRDQYFVDGMSEALIARLGRIENLKVISRTTMMKFRGSELTIPEIATRLNVDAIVEGSVLTTESEVRITIQLIDGRTDHHLWSQNYARKPEGVVTLQTDVAEAVAGELLPRLIASDNDSQDGPLELGKTPTSNPDAYRAYLKGRFNANHVGEDTFRAAIQHYEEALRLDPAFALAYASLAEVCTQPIVVHSGMLSLDDCKEAALRATSLDESLAEGYAALGVVQLIDWEWAASEQSLERAINLNPNSVMARQWRSLLFIATSRFDDALAEIRIAQELDPLNLFVRTMVGWPLYDMRRYEEALVQWNDVLALDPEFMLAYYNRGVAFIELRDAEKVLEQARRIEKITSDRQLEARLLRASALAIAGESTQAKALLLEIERDAGKYMAAWIASIYLMMEEEGAALDRLERGLEERAPDMFTICEPKFDPIRNHPRFLEIQKKMGLIDADLSRDSSAAG